MSTINIVVVGYTRPETIASEQEKSPTGRRRSGTVLSLEKGCTFKDTYYLHCQIASFIIVIFVIIYIRVRLPEHLCLVEVLLGIIHSSPFEASPPLNTCPDLLPLQINKNKSFMFRLLCCVHHEDDIIPSNNVKDVS